MNRLWLAFLLAFGCGGAARYEIVSARDVPSSSGAPSVRTVTDLGEIGTIPLAGNLPAPDSDGTFVVGELVLIEGSDLGKQPTVTIGGRPATVLARIGSGSILTRIPPGVATGKAQVEVSHPGGRGSLAIEVRRYGFAVEPGANKVHVLAVGANGSITAAGAITVPGARDVAFSANGQTALVAADGQGGARLAVIAVTAAKGPRLVRELRIAGDARAVESAPLAPIAAILGQRQVVLVDLEDASMPAPYEPHRLAEPSPITAAAFAPDGKTLALLYAQGNRVIPLDLGNPAAPAAGAAVALLPDERVPLARDLAFSPAGDALWAITGDSAESVRAGEHPTRLVSVRTADTMAVERTVDVTGAAAPLALVVARREDVQAAAAVQSSSLRVAMILAEADRALVAGAAAAQGAALSGSRLAQLDLEGALAPLAEEAGVMTSLALSHDASLVAALVVRPAAGGREIGVRFMPLATPARGATPGFLRLGQVAGAMDHTAVLAMPGSIALAP